VALLAISVAASSVAYAVTSAAGRISIPIERCKIEEDIRSRRKAPGADEQAAQGNLIAVPRGGWHDH
jgi:hypothetical protein